MICDAYSCPATLFDIPAAAAAAAAAAVAAVQVPS